MLGVLAVLLVAVGILAASFIKKGENATMVLNKDGSAEPVSIGNDELESVE
ncbi:hypothetical protein [Mediterraneibacter faecis]|uniref:hypothetical protein n=1 Tax=Mediterraneibacter faecis TaxID=592978 RepID=UPI001D06B69A|nr:hypothetical protein [Mediterraneibacter faecis]MCB5891335.1 hypothetical protein [Lachnospiraceae bacterium 210521-DFI.4.71]MCB7114464.1 hypothetical protein [Mediterraneibacter faecis]MCB7117608.1 hypothetical protein [Mediterraneibacter faecis]MCB7290236.1 hypothetical protein [Mediterraneibacter faecis]MCB7425866.1 hypothetical protein [Mediterraneibacter faecis]